MPRRSCTAHGAALRLSSIIRLEGIMRVIFLLPPLLVAGAAMGGLFAPLAVGSVPTDGIGIAATERHFGAENSRAFLHVDVLIVAFVGFRRRREDRFG